MSSVYIVGSLKNIEKIQAFAHELRCCQNVVEVEDAWTSHGDQPDICFYKYSVGRGWTYAQALSCPVATSVFETDKNYIDTATAVIMLQPCGPSAALELGYAAGCGKVCVIIKESTTYTKVDIMEKFADIIANNQEDFFINHLDNFLTKVEARSLARKN